MKKPGYILVLTLLIVSLAIALISVVVRESFSYAHQSHLVVDKERARLLVMSSFAIVESQLSHVVAKEKEKKEEGQPQRAAQQQQQQKATDKEKLEPLQEWLLKVMQIINRWQTIKLSGDNLEGEIRWYLASEQGKIPLSLFEDELFGAQPEAAQQKPEKPNGQVQPPPGQAASKEQQTQKKSPLSFFDQLIKKERAVTIQEGLRKFVGSYQRMPEDITELLRYPSFVAFKEKMFMTPDAKKPFFLMDLFTSLPSKGINPWLLSASLKTLLGISAKESKADKALVKRMKGRVRWENEWDTLFSQFYGKKFNALEKGFGDYLSSEFEAQSFSVVSYCTVASVTFKLYALFERTKPDKDESSESVLFKVTKLVWL